MAGHVLVKNVAAVCAAVLSPHMECQSKVVEIFWDVAHHRVPVLVSGLLVE